MIESGGDNLTATFSPRVLVDAQIFVLDVAGGGYVARKGGPEIARAVVDAMKARQSDPVLALTRKDQTTVDRLCDWIRAVLVEHRAGRHTPRDPGPMAPHSHTGGDLQPGHRHEH